MRTKRQFTSRILAGLTLAGAAAFTSTGCANDGPGATIGDFRSNPTPELITAARTGDEVANRLTITNDTNLRYLMEDLGRVLLLDRPSTLSPRGLYLY